MTGNTIHINEMLSLLTEPNDEAFLIEFVRAKDSKNGKAGSIKSCHCYYGAPNPKDRQAVTGIAASRSRKKFLDSNSIPLTEAGSRRLHTPFLSHIIKFNGRKIYR